MRVCFSAEAASSSVKYFTLFATFFISLFKLPAAFFISFQLCAEIKIGNYLVAEENKVAKEYKEKEVKEYMKWDSIDIEVNLDIGSAEYKVYTCDFTHDYIEINADYRN